ncbi:site-specific tyrosine recombinase XerC [Bacteroidales bacterium Barb6XT]|nr:site-specific tyrosine recombinase XerC [Bacteroidales bacterium Barb6XT]
MRVVYGGTRVDFATSYRIDASKWDADKQQVKKGCTNKLKQSSTEINADLSKYITEIQAIFKDFEMQNAKPTLEQLKASFNKSGQKSAKASFWAVFDEFVSECGTQNNWTKATYQKFSAVKKHLAGFDAGLTLDALDESKLNKYAVYLRDAKDMRNSTIGKQTAFLKWFLRWSVKKEYNTNTAYDAYKPKLKSATKKVIFLTWDELTKLREYSIPATKQYLERVRDVFLFTCFTGLRYSDAYNLKRSDIKDDRIEITTVKTADSLIIELNDHSRAVLDKYRDTPLPDNKALPVVTNQKMNLYLKELALMARG